MEGVEVRATTEKKKEAEIQTGFAELSAKRLQRVPGCGAGHHPEPRAGDSGRVGCLERPIHPGRRTRPDPDPARSDSPLQSDPCLRIPLYLQSGRDQGRDPLQGGVSLPVRRSIGIGARRVES